MLVYGDHAASESTRDKLDRVSGGVADAFRLSAGIERHAGLVDAFIEAGELLQGVADGEFDQHRSDAPSEAQKAVTAVLMALAGCVWQSWLSGFSQPRAPPDLGPLPNLRQIVTVRRPEGFAFYGLYPEAYGEAAASLAGRSLQVIGIRSIGTGLSAMVAAAADAPPPVTVRPIGHPFRRALAIGPALRSALLARPPALFAIVDEGPGLSGSSFGAVADWLQSQGIESRQIHFFPSHGNDLGSEASDAHRRQWAQASRHIAEFETFILHARCRPHRLQSWIADLIGPVDEPLTDISAGNWRCHRYASEHDWPPANPQQERRKYLAKSGGKTWLCKFAGLGRLGREKLARANILSQAGFTPAIAGLRHGFMIERWIEPISAAPDERQGFIDRVGAYLAFRAREMPAGNEYGASLLALAQMAGHNVAQACGQDAARRLSADISALPEMESRVRRVATDNRLHHWEWLHRAGGPSLKADALDHCRGHDLIGCQDIAWDVVGAAVELTLTAPELEQVCIIIERETGRGVDIRLLLLLEPCYLAFQLGYYVLAAQTASMMQNEFARIERSKQRYTAALQTMADRS